MCRASETPIERMKAALADFPGWLARQRDAAALGEPLIAMGEVVDRCEAGRAELLRRFEKSGAWQAEGALSVVAWLRWKCKLSGGAAAERVGIARQLEKLPQTEQAFSRGEVGYQHMALIAGTADNVGTATVRKTEAQLLQAAQTMDPGRFAGVTKTSSTGSTPKGRWRSTTGPTPAASCTWASRAMAWCGSTACSMPKVGRRCRPRSTPS